MWQSVRSLDQNCLTNTVDEKETDTADLVETVDEKAPEVSDPFNEKEPALSDDEDGNITRQIEEAAFADDFRIVLDVVKYWREGIHDQEAERHGKAVSKRNYR